MEQSELLAQYNCILDEERQEKEKDEILLKMLECNTYCAGNFKTPYEFCATEDELITYLFNNLPGANYIVDKLVNLIFSNGLTTGDKDQDVILKEWIYALNINNVTNYSVMQHAIKIALVYGKCGIRILSREAGIISYLPSKYGSIEDLNEEYGGFKETVGYIISYGKQNIYDVDLSKVDLDINEYLENQRQVDPDKKLMILSEDEFLNLRNDTSTEHGDSPFHHDIQRIKLLATWYERLNYDLTYDGTGRIIVRLNSDYLTDPDVDATNSTSKLFNNSTQEETKRKEKVMAELANVAKQLKESKSDSVIGMSPAFSDNITHLPRVTKATELLDFYANTRDVEIVAQIIGIPSVLADVGEVSGNISQESKIDDAILNYVIPMREKFAIQLSNFLSDLIGVDKFYFDKYELKQAVDEVTQLKNRVQTIREAWLAEQDELVQILVDDLINDLVPVEGVRKLANKASKKIINKSRRWRKKRR